MVASARFAPVAVDVATDLRFPDARILTVGHPLGGTDEATILQWADEAVETALALFTGAS